jgi:hypothetical protein
MVVDPNACLVESYPIVILSESVLRGIFRFWIKVLGMPIQFELPTQPNLPVYINLTQPNLR